MGLFALGFTMTFTPCRAHLCPALVTRKDKGFCEAHADKRYGWNRRKPQAGATTKRGYGHPWTKLRAQVMARDEYVCQVCASRGRLTPASEVDHIQNKATGGTDELSNLQAICKPCHKLKTQKESQKVDNYDYFY